MNDLIFFYKHFASEPRGGWDKINIEKVDGVYYVHISLIEFFLDNYANKEKDIVLVTEGSDLCIHDTNGEIHIANTNKSDTACRFSRSKVHNIKHWFSTNNNSVLPINSIPCGFWRKINEIPNIKSQEEKKNKILFCCNPANNMSIRVPLHNKFFNDPNVEIVDFPKTSETNQSDWSKTTMSHSFLLNVVNDYKYVICPESNGLDTNRLWECTLLNSVPLTNNLRFYNNIRYMTNLMSYNLLNLDTDTIINNTKNVCDKTHYLTNNFWINKIKEAAQ